MGENVTVTVRPVIEATEDGPIYRINKNGKIFKYVGWQLLDSNSNNAAISASDHLFRIDYEGQIYKYIPEANQWANVDASGQAQTIATGGPWVYQLHHDGSIWRSDAVNIKWGCIDRNPDTASIAADRSTIYQLHKDHSIYKNDGRGKGWERIGNDLIYTRSIVAQGDDLYQLHAGGSIWKYDGSGTSWDEIDNNPATVQVTAGATGIYQRHKDSSLYIHNTALVRWDLILDATHGVVDISAGNDGLYALKVNGESMRYDNKKAKWFDV